MHRSHPLILFAAALFCLPLTAAAKSPEKLQSPWDQPVVPSQGYYFCGAYTPVGPDITITNALGNNLSADVKEAVIAESTTGVNLLSHRIIHAADNYRLTGSHDAAVCVYSLLAAAARAQALTGEMANNDAWTAQRTALRMLSIALLKVRGSNVATPQDDALIHQWLVAVVNKDRKYYEHTKCGKNVCDMKDHRGLSVAVAATAVGIAANNSGLYEWGLKQYRDVIHNINSSGMSDYDTHGTYAMKSNIETAGHLVMIAELALANDENLYEYRNGTIHLLVRTVARGIVSPDTYRKAVREDQTMTLPLSWQIGWATAYNRRFPTPIIDSLLTQVGPNTDETWGGQL